MSRVTDKGKVPERSAYIIERTLRVSRGLFSRTPDSLPMRSPLFSSNPLKRWVVTRRLHLIAGMIESVVSTESVLDFGTGFGVLLPVLASKFRTVTAVDVDADQLESTRTLVSSLGLAHVDVIRVTEGQELGALGDRRFDCVIAADVLEHIENLPEAVVTLSKVCKTGGCLIVSLPTENILYRMFESHESGHVAESSEAISRIVATIQNHFEVIETRNVFWFFRVHRCVKRVTPQGGSNSHETGWQGGAKWTTKNGRMSPS